MPMRLKRNLVLDILLPNLFEWHAFFYQIGIQEVFENLGSIETPQTCVSTDISKQTYCDHQ
jgi:hypothetical protein